jgi:hypothetical protein
MVPLRSGTIETSPVHLAARVFTLAPASVNAELVRPKHEIQSLGAGIRHVFSESEKDSTSKLSMVGRVRKTQTQPVERDAMCWQRNDSSGSRTQP